MGKFDNKVALITGASSGIGRATAIRLAELGANIVLVDINEEGTKETLDLATDKGVKGTFIKADTSKASDVENYVNKAVEEFGTIDYFFNNAGIVGDTKNITEQDIDQIDATIDINLKGAMYGLKYVIPVMLKNGGGSIVNTSSGSGLVGTPGMSSYVASKHGVVGITKTVALEFAEQNIRVNAIAPGSTKTNIISGIDPEAQKQIEADIPMQRMGEAEDMVDAVEFLFSDHASYITGVVLPVDGGYVA